MSDIPAPPPPASPPPPTPPPFNAAQAVNGPAIGLMVVVGVGALINLLSLLANLFGLGMSGMGGFGGMEGEMPAWAATMASGSFSILLNLIALVTAVFIFLAARKMQNLQDWNWGLGASIAAMVPCISPCCILGLPIGIWAVIVLSKPEVKNAFTS